MPIYEYRCTACGHDLEKMQKLADAPLTDCPACGQPTLKKQISAAGFRLKGSGWYETDFKQGEKKKNLHGDSEKSDGGGAASKSDTTKPDTTKSDTPKPADSGSKPTPPKPAAKSDAA